MTDELTALTKQATPGDVTSVRGLHSAMGVSVNHDVTQLKADRSATASDAQIQLEGATSSEKKAVDDLDADLKDFFHQPEAQQAFGVESIPQVAPSTNLL